jgi:hypothetical protein
MVTLTTTGRTDTQIYSSGTRRPFVPPMPDE